MATAGSSSHEPYASDIAALRSVALFHGLCDGDLQALASAATRREYSRGELMLGPGSREEEGLFVIVSGAARLYRLSASGQEITLAYLSGGDIYGLVFVEPPTKPKSSVEATINGTLAFRIARPFFRRFVEAHPDIAVHALGLVSRRLADAYDLIEDLALHDTRTRLARTLVRLASTGGTPAIYTTHAELAVMVGTTREKVTKLLGDLRQRGLVSYEPHRRGIQVHLDRFAEELGLG
jgi:CRP/FNR family transcriptional regulator